MRLLHLGTVESTQDEARTLYDEGERGPVWIRAERQTKGRGRRDRNWVSETGNLFATLIQPASEDPSQSALYGFAVSLAIAQTLDRYNPIKPAKLKWPNDVLIGGSKISGLLVEREAEALLIGVGMNLVSHPSDTPYPATHLVEQMQGGDLMNAEPLFTGPEAVLALLSRNVEKSVRMFRTHGFDLIRREWMARAHNPGGTVTVNDQTGRFTGLGPDGALCLTRPDGTEVRVHAGDVAFG
ncbi:biotin--[acetyl-CoA-carboxylase] ligase [uncultured Algimonas sp.]|uniref:biotin--[acetyl-CoA-carboxylase] ligase n=1 Tax=uncultured Algimonas sp. TaxID=1547920 RepID=UPI0026082C3E|nr:biotin--[acetyl-CoA-carboxylase] ligase [uncultured Algimonas sp.]